ncbi:hypothetical protein [Natrinema amylolyticum]|uniref:hypothetical protein n=1 Tax=Natrinema amylolyticum TaxID=2878679 RepID=UPI001CFAA2CA|nr:hypothetical protein [Natrinema amylolyticum]
MPDIASDKATAVTYPPQPLYDKWCQQADSLNMSISQFLIRMVEVGRKQVDLEDIAEESLRDLHNQVTDLQRELNQQRTRNQKLERQLHRTVHGEILDYVEDNPGVTTPEIMQYVADTVPSRVASYLDLLEGDELELRDGEYYLQETDSGHHLASTDGTQSTDE